MVTEISPSAAAVAGRVVRATALRRLTIAAALLLTSAALGAGIALRRKSPKAASRTQNASLRADHAALQKSIVHPPGPFWDQSDVPLDVQGQVLDPHGKPLAGAELYVGYSVRRFVQRGVLENALAGPARPGPYPRRATTGTDGRFHFRFATSQLDPRLLDDARPAVMAIAAGYGPAWAEIGPAALGDLKFQLVDDFPVSGRVLDPKRRPVTGAKLVIRGIYSAPVDELPPFLKGNSMDGWAPRCWKGPLPGNAPTILTDAEGRWRCGGLGRDRIAVFALDGPGVPRTFLNVATRPGAEAFPIADVHGPAFDYLARTVRTIRGSVRDQATRKPIAGVMVTTRPGNAAAHTGPDGRFEIFDYSRLVGHGLVAQPEAGQPYFAGQVCVFERAGAAELIQDLLLVSGIVLSGRVMNHSTGKPPEAFQIPQRIAPPDPPLHSIPRGPHSA
jgi:hypothetical protein